MIIIDFAVIGDNTSERIQGLGDKIIVRAKDNEERVETVGAGGWGGGVRLLNSDKQTQDVNRINLERFVKKQRREIKKREKAARQKEYLERKQESWRERFFFSAGSVQRVAFTKRLIGWDRIKYLQAALFEFN